MAQTPTTDFTSNGILSSLSDADCQLLDPHLTQVPLPVRTHIESPFRVVPYVYFLQSGIASVIAISKHQRRQSEAGLMGFEGMTGLAIVHGTDRSPCNVMMQVAGQGLQIKAGQLRCALLQSSTLRDSFSRFGHVFSVQAQHTALSNAQGTIPERLARWLLMIHDRTHGDQLHMTHALISLMVGSRRAGVTIALGQFAAAGLIETHRGNITITNRNALELAADGLYGVPEDEYRRLFTRRVCYSHSTPG